MKSYAPALRPLSKVPVVPRHNGVRAFLATVFGVWAAVLVILLFSGDKLHALPLMAATILPAVLYASNNPRLFLLMCAVGTNVMGLSINFGFAPHIGGAASYSFELVDAFLVPLLVFIVRDHVQGRRAHFRIGTVSNWWLAAMALGLMSLTLGPFRQYAAFELLRMFKCWLLFLVIVNEVVRERQFHHVLVALGLSVAGNVAISFAQFALKRTLGLQALGEAGDEAVLGANLGVYGGGADVYRISGLLGHPNLFSTFLAMLLPIFLALMFSDHGARARMWLSALCIAGLAALLLTLSRTGWAAFATAMVIVMGFLYVHPLLSRRGRGMKIGLLLGFVLAVLIAAPIIVTRVSESDAGALDSRYEMMGVAWRMVQAKPVFGFGLNSFSFQMLDYAPYSVGRMQEIYGPIPTVVHNIYMLVWAEQGTVGLLLFLGLNAHVLWIAYRNTRYRLSYQILLLNVGAIGAIAALLVDGLGSFYMRVPGPARVFWLLAGLVVASKYWNESNLAWRRAQAASAAPSDRAAGPAVAFPSSTRS